MVRPVLLLRKFWRLLLAVHAAPGLWLLAKGSVKTRELQPDAVTPDPLSPAYPEMVGEAALRRLGLRPGSLPGPQMALRGRRHEWQRLISARSHAAVERMIAARVRR